MRIHPDNKTNVRHWAGTIIPLRRLDDRLWAACRQAAFGREPAKAAVKLGRPFMAASDPLADIRVKRLSLALLIQTRGCAKPTPPGLRLR